MDESVGKSVMPRTRAMGLPQSTALQSTTQISCLRPALQGIKEFCNPCSIRYVAVRCVIGGAPGISFCRAIGLYLVHTYCTSNVCLTA